MNLTQWWETWPAVQVTGWVLMHFLWQGALIVVVVASAVWAMRERSANARYLVCVAGLLCMIAAPIITLFVVLRMQAGIDHAALPLPVPLDLPVTESLLGRLGAALPAITGAWLVGVLVFQTRLMLNFSRAQRLRRAGTTEAPVRWRNVVSELCEQMGVRASVRVLESSLAQVPAMIGWLNPVILIPASALTGLSPDQLRAIIAHELAHVRRHDYAVNVVQSIVETVLFYHPAVWWISGRLRVEREYCCDDVAVSVCGDTLCYAQALSTLDSLRAIDVQPALASTGGSLMDRIRRLVHARGATPRRTGALIAPLITVMTLTITLSALAVTAKVDVAKTPEQNAVESVDIVGILKHTDSDHADMIEALDHAGLDNDVLITVLRELGTEGQTMQAIDRATERAVFVEQSLGELREHLAAELASGRTSMQDARIQLNVARLNSERAWEVERHQQAGATGVVDLLLPDSNGQQHFVVAETVPDDALMQELHLAPALVEIAGGNGYVMLEPVMVDEVGQKLRYIRANIQDQVAAGVLTEAQAEAHIAAAREQMQAMTGIGLTDGHFGLIGEHPTGEDVVFDDFVLAEGEAAGTWVDMTGELQELGDNDFFFAEQAVADDEHVKFRVEHEALTQELMVVHEQLAKEHDQIALALDEGEISREEAHVRLDQMRSEVMEVQREIERQVHRLHPPTKQRIREDQMREIHEQFKLQMEAGKFDKAHNTIMLLPHPASAPPAPHAEHPLHPDHPAPAPHPVHAWHPGHPASAPLAAVNMRFGPEAEAQRVAQDQALMTAVRRHLELEVEAGRLETEAARARLEAIQRSLKESAPKIQTAVADVDKARAKLHAARAELERAIEVGDLSRSDLIERIEKLRAIESELHERHRREKMHEH